MKKIIQSEAGAQAFKDAVEVNKNGVDNTTANHYKSGADKSTLNSTKRMPKNNDEDDDLMKRSDFRYFYSGRKLL